LTKLLITYLTDDFTDEAIHFIDENENNPFFIYLAYNAPHAPDHATAKYLEKTKHIEYAGRSVYGAMVNAVDYGVGKIDSTLVTKGLKENTVIVFLSDNGGRIEHADNRPNRGHKGMLFEGGIKVPFSMTWPNGIKGNKTYSNPISALDIFPTFVNMAGFWRSSGGFEYAVRKGNYKLYKSAYKEKTLLFDIDKDPKERTDISENNKKIIDDLELAYKEWNSKNMDPGWFDPHAENVIKEEKRFRNDRNKSLHPKVREIFEN